MGGCATIKHPGVHTSEGKLQRLYLEHANHSHFGYALPRATMRRRYRVRDKRRPWLGDMSAGAAFSATGTFAEEASATTRPASSSILKSTATASVDPTIAAPAA